MIKDAISYIDLHSVLTVVIVTGMIVMSVMKIDIPEFVYALLAAVSPGLVFKKKSAAQSMPLPGDMEISSGEPKA